MKLNQWITTLQALDLPTSLPFVGDAQKIIRFYFLHAAFESGLLKALEKPASREEIFRKLQVKRPDIFDALLYVGLACGELTQSNEHYQLKGKRAKALVKDHNDPLVALIQALCSYYNDIYRDSAEQLRGAPKLPILNENGELIARVSRISEPYLYSFVRELVSRRKPKRLLEIGCGSGTYIRCAAEAEPSLHGLGVEIDAAVAQQASTNLQQWGLSNRFQIIVDDVREPKVAYSGPFDLITLYNNIYYFQETEKVALFGWIRSLLSDRGVLALVSSFQTSKPDLNSANLNIATSAMVGCTPLPKLDQLADLLASQGYIQIKKSQLAPGSGLFGLIASR